jgi:hypothetical protein
VWSFPSPPLCHFNFVSIKVVKGLKLTFHLFLVPRLKMLASTPPITISPQILVLNYTHETFSCPCLTQLKLQERVYSLHKNIFHSTQIFSKIYPWVILRHIIHFLLTICTDHYISVNKSLLFVKWKVTSTNNPTHIYIVAA